MAVLTARRLDRPAPKSVCGLLKLLAVIQWFYFIFSSEPLPPPPQVIVLRRGGTKKIRIFFCPASSQHYNSGGGGGGFTGGKKLNHCITAKSFSNPHTDFGAGRSRPWQLGLPQIRKCHFWSDPCVFGYIF